MRELLKKDGIILKICLVLLPIIAAIAALGIGRYMLSVPEVIEVLAGKFSSSNVPAVNESVVMSVRLPRIILALLVEMGLSVAGAAFQGLFSNPLATPDTLGVAACASFGAAIALLFTENMFAVQISALVFGLIAVCCTYLISKIQGKSTILMVVLAGMVTSSFFEALISLIKYVADPETKLPTITYWLMGSMASISYQNLLMGVPFILAGIIIIYLLRWKLNILALSEDEAKTMGIKVANMRWIVIIAATLITASAVSMCGKVGWIGLLIPHISRMLVGINHKRVIPVSISLGAAYMIVIDTCARSIAASEIPLSILTVIIGAPFFAYLLRKTGGGWS